MTMPNEMKWMRSWPTFDRMTETLRRGSEESAAQGKSLNKEPPKMDFQVGDVVRFSSPLTGYKRPAGYTVDRIDEDGLLHLDGDAATTTWFPWRFELVSRPWTPKAGDRVLITRFEHPSGPGRVVAIVGPTDHDPLCEGIRVRMDSGTMTHCCSRKELERLEDPKPMTATQAAIEHQDQIDALRYAAICGSPAMSVEWQRSVDREILEACQRAAAKNGGVVPRPKEIRSVDEYALKPLWVAHPSVLDWKGLENIQPGMIVSYDEDPNDGWMPAGTYLPMPVTDVKPMRFSKARLPYQEARCRDSLPPSVDGNGTRLWMPETIPHKHRRLQTSSWDPMDDTFLEDE